MLRNHLVDHPEERARVKLRFCLHLGTGNTESFLKVFLVPYQDIRIFNNPGHYFDGLLLATPEVPEFLTEIQVEADNSPRLFRRLHSFDDELTGGFGQCGKDTAAVKPANPAGKDLIPPKVSRLELCGRFIRTVVEHHRGTDTLPAVTVHSCHIGTSNAIVLEALVERLHPHGAYPFGDKVADRIINHRGHDAGVQSEAIRQVGGNIELTATHMDMALRCLAKRDDAWIQTMHQCTDGNKIEGGFFTNGQACTHFPLPSRGS